jgi:low affinity Fe/Cu permease
MKKGLMICSILATVLVMFTGCEKKDDRMNRKFDEAIDRILRKMDEFSDRAIGRIESAGDRTVNKIEEAADKLDRKMDQTVENSTSKVEPSTPEFPKRTDKAREKTAEENKEEVDSVNKSARPNEFSP